VHDVLKDLRITGNDLGAQAQGQIREKEKQLKDKEGKVFDLAKVIIRSQETMAKIVVHGVHVLIST